MIAGFLRVMRRLAGLWRPARSEADVTRELTSHLLLLEDEYRRRGLSADEARRRARIALGGLEQTRERHREARSLPWLEDAGGDLAYAVRGLRDRPGFAAAIVLTLALAIAGTGAVFNLVDGVLVRPLPYRDPSRLVLIQERSTLTGLPGDSVAPINYRLLVGHNDAFESIAAVADHSVTLFDAGTPEKVEARRVTHTFFDVPGVAPAQGRAFRADEDRPGAPLVTVLSHRLWQRRFAGDPSIVGRPILLGREPAVVVGVMPPDFQFLAGDPALWVPIAFTAEELERGANYLTIVARPRPGMTPAQAQGRLEALAARLAPELPPAAEQMRLSVTPLDQRVTAAARRPLLVLLGAVVVVLLIACANVASLLLARGAARRHEIALRSSLGASRGRLVRQLLAESSVLSALGLAAGVVLAHWTLAFLTRLVPPTMTQFVHPALDGPTLAVMAGAAAAAAALFGLAPALHATAVDRGGALRAASRGEVGAESRRGALVVGEVAMTLILLVVASLLLQTLYRLRYADLGFQPERVITLRTTLAGAAYASHAQRTAFYDQVLDRVGRLPGVVSAAYATAVPLAWKGATTGFTIEGAAPRAGIAYEVNMRQVSAGYFRTIGIPLAAGRLFGEGDRAGTPRVAIVNAAMARQYFPGRSPLGQRIHTDDQDAPWLTIVGVVGDVRQMGLDAPARAELYVPHRQFDAQPWFAPRDLAVRTAGDAAALVPAITREVHAVDAELPVSHARTMTAILDEEVASRRIGVVVLVAFAAFAVLLSAIGIYGVISFFVAQHVPEIGVRIALGAQSRDVVALVAGRGVRLALAGLALGLVGAFGATGLVSSLLYGVSELDPASFAAGAVLLLLLATVASVAPALRAARLDPVAALRGK